MKAGIISIELIWDTPSHKLAAGSYLCPNKRLKRRIVKLRQAEASARRAAENLENELQVRQMAEDAHIAAGRLIRLT